MSECRDCDDVDIVRRLHIVVMQFSIGPSQAGNNKISSKEVALDQSGYSLFYDYGHEIKDFHSPRLASLKISHKHMTRLEGSVVHSETDRTKNTNSTTE